MQTILKTMCNFEKKIMVEIGKYNSLKINKEVDFGLYLDGGEDGEILLPLRYKPEKYEIDEFIEVFIYFDSEDRIIATTLKPFAIVGEFAVLDVVEVNNFGAFLDWGLPKDLFVPFREQAQRLETGETCVVYILVDKDTKRLMASAKIERFLDNIPPVYEIGREVDLVIYDKTDIGYKAIINSLHTGILYHNEVFQPLTYGEKVKGYVRKIREDEKIDLILHKPGYGKVNMELEAILLKLKENDGFLPLTDKTSPEIIYEHFGISKKTFKQAIGALYKSKKISIQNNGIRLV